MAKFIIVDDDMAPLVAPTLIERHDGTEKDAKRTLLQWMEPGDRLHREEHETVIILRVVSRETLAPTGICAVLKK